MNRITKRLLVLMTAVSLLYSASDFAQSQTHSAVPVDLEIPIAPTPVKADGKVHLVYELHITNFDKPARDLTLTRLEVLGEGQDAAPLARLVGEDLAKQMGRPGAPNNLSEKRRIAGGMRAIVFIWITADSVEAVPRTLRHRLAFAIEKVNGERTVEGAVVEVRRDAPIVIGPPLRGEGWMAANGPSNREENQHRRAINTVDGKARIAQRFAIDWIKFGQNGQLWSRDLEKNSDWFGYGAEILAVADAVVASVNDGVPENKPDTESRAVPITLETSRGCIAVATGPLNDSEPIAGRARNNLEMQQLLVRLDRYPRIARPRLGRIEIPGVWYTAVYEPCAITEVYREYRHPYLVAQRSCYLLILKMMLVSPPESFSNS